MRIAINVVCVKGDKILLVQKGKVWILPGGKPEGTENDRDCLVRELSEELPDAVISVDHYYDEFEGQTPHSGDMLQAKVYLGTFTGGNITPAAELSDSAWVGREEVSDYNLSEITREIVEAMLEDGTF